MRKSTIFLSLILLSLLAHITVNILPYGHADEDIVKTTLSPYEAPLPFKAGERFAYDVQYQNMDIGESILTFNGEKEIGGKRLYHVTFFTKIPTFKDTEELYADKKTFLPLEIHRTIKKKIGFNDRIVEKYDQENFRVDISQKSNLRSKNFSIEKDSPIHNAILLTYYYRTRESFNRGDRFKITLPTIDFDVMFKGIVTIDTPMGEYKAYAFTSEPSRFKFWLSRDERRIPLKIKNPGTSGYSLVIKSIE